MSVKFKYLCFVALLVLGICQNASAELAQVGPIVSTTIGHGFPSYYMDENGLALQLCLTSGSCNFDSPVSGNTFSGNIGFGQTAFYWSADAEISSVGDGGAGSAPLHMALTATFSGNTIRSIPADGSQIVFVRISVGPITGLTPNQVYKVTHPYGVLMNLRTDSSGTIPIQIQDVGCAMAPCGDFSAALGGGIGPFLIWNPVSDAPAGYIGEPGTAHAVTGSPFGTNYFRIDGPDAGGSGVNHIQTNTFNVQGKKFVSTGAMPTPLVVNESTYTRPLPSAINVLATSMPGATLQVNGTGFSAPAQMTENGAGGFFAHIKLTGSLPSTITVTSTNSPNTPVTIISAVVDVVTIILAEYNSDLKTLTIEASSSDLTSPPTLTANGFGNLAAGKLVASGVTVPPVEVTVVSSAGGSDTAQVTVTALTAPVAKNDIGLTLTNIPVDINVLANDIGRSGPLDPSTVNIVTPPSQGTPSINLTTGVVTYTPNAGFFGKDKFTYQVGDIYYNSGFPKQISNVATVNINVVASETLTITKAVYTTKYKWWQISGKSTVKAPGDTITLHLGDASGTVIGTATVNAVFGSWSFSKLSSSVVPGTPPVNITAVSTLGTTQTATVTIK
ncbi:MAG: Ig-like domain-containing protein [Thermodesulfobacteriota bacterium]|jgi:hypothetical protein